MKTLKKSILLLTSLVVAMSAASCVNAELTEPETGKAVKELATIDEQAASMEATVADLEALQAAAEGREEEIAGAVSALEEHIADLKAGTPLLEGTLATLAQQKKLAGLIATIGGGTEPTKAAAVTKAVASIDKGACRWLGKHFASYYPAVKAEAAAKARLASYDFRAEKILVEGVLSDVEAGLRKEFDAKELAALAAGIGANAEQAEELAASLSAVTAEVEEGYTKAVETAVDDPENFDLPALTELNSTVAGALADADNTLAGLIARVEECETQVAELKDRVAALEGEIADLNELFGMIQSVTFMSEYSVENAIAYYTLGTEAREDGKMQRTPQGTIDLNYIVRPASAAAALAVQDLWNDEVKVFGYYAQTITKATPEMVDFAISNIEADESGSGIVTVTVSASALSEEFYFKEKGAKLALSVTTGKTDLTTKFVEIVPKDASGSVYVESISLSTDYAEVDNGKTVDLNVTLSPEDITVDGVVWTSSDDNVAIVSAEGVVTAKAVGEVVITATTNSTDEWGNKLFATCKVKVNPAIKLKGPDTVTEQGGTAELMLTLPENYPYNSITWTSSNNLWATVDENGVVTGVTSIMQEEKDYVQIPDGNGGYTQQEIVRDRYYCKVTITCDIDGVKLQHVIQVVKVQPTAVSIAGRDFNDNTITMKSGTTQTLGEVSMYPEKVDKNVFEIDVNAGLGYNPASYNVDSRVITANYPGTHYITFSYSALAGEYWTSYQRPDRTLTIIVQPYWVESVSLPDAFEMNVDQTATLTPTFTSDIEGKDPSYMDLKWTSSNPDIVSINETTGEMTSHQEGTVMITATTSHADAVPSGQAQKSATCAVTVKKPTAPISIGDYYYSDGTWSTELDAGKTVIGIVFAKVNAAASDVQMINDYPGCSNGLVVSLAQYETPMQENGASWSRNTYFDWMNGNGYTQVQDKEKYSGYGTTKGMIAINSAGVSDSSGTVYLDLCEPILQHRNSVTAPDSSSGWYLPSFKEMTLLYDNFDAVNSALESAGGTQMTKQYSYLYNSKTYTKNQKYYCTYVNNGSNWTAFDMNTAAESNEGKYSDGQYNSTTLPKAAWPVRVILAF